MLQRHDATGAAGENPPRGEVGTPLTLVAIGIGLLSL
jgi:hypothetical protein